jgi:hypothetical protein
MYDLCAVSRSHQYDPMIDILETRKSSQRLEDMNRKATIQPLPMIADEAAWSDEVTSYDQDHLITYARLLDAEAEKARWQEAARIILRQDPEAQPERALRCWKSHLARANWFATTGYRQLVAKAEARRAASGR